MSFYPVGYVTRQGANSTTFTVPPQDGSFIFPDWLDWHVERSHDHPYAVLVGETDGEASVTVTWGEVARSVYRFAAKLRQTVPDVPIAGEPPVIGILANPDTLTYVTIIMAIVRAGFTAFPLSVRNSLPALEHLINKTHCQYIIGSIPSKGYQSSALQETTAMLLQKIPNLNLLDLPRYSTLYPRLAQYPPAPYDAVSDKAITPSLAPVRTFASYRDFTLNTPLYILHSSGSTSFPKPIPISHRAWLSWGRTFWYGDVDVCGSTWATMTLPIFHIMGVAVTVGFPICSGSVALMFKPSDPPKPPTPDRVLATARRAKADYMLTVPSFCVEWAEDPEAVKFLAGLKCLLYGGGPLPQEKGDHLVASGVNIAIAYGSTEVGLMFKLVPKEPLRGTEWGYSPFCPGVTNQMVPDANGLYRLVVTDTEKHGICATNSEDGMSFDTNDLLEPHPTKPGYWKVIGRADDQIMMSNGEKTNPGPMENIINGNIYIRAAVMFGRARTQVGIIIEPVETVQINSDEDLANFRNLIWPDIEKANAFAPQHSRIFKEFILVSDPRKKPLIKTAKGTVSRNAIFQQYAEEIDAIYTAAEHPIKAEWAQPPQMWDEKALHEFVVRIVAGVMRSENSSLPPVDENRDLFEQGCDSLQATYIRAAITNALREAPKPEGKSDIAAVSVPQNLVFAFPTIRRLAAYMIKAVGGINDDTATQTAEAIEEMLAMIDKYTHDFPVHKSANRSVDGEVVLITGTTGTLGTYLLQELLDDFRVSRVYAVNRPSADKGLPARQRKAFVDRGVEGRLLLSSKLHLLEADTTRPDLGLDSMTLGEIRSSVTAIIHNAWRLDFNLSLSSFESHVKSTRNLVDLALSVSAPSAAQIIFTSSIGTLQGWREPRAVPENPIDDPTVALGNGYGESKWVAERVMVAAAEQRGIHATIWRVGQLAGSTQNGAWNTTDWVPIIAKGGKVMNALPSFPGGNVSWLPTDSAAKAIVDGLHNIDADSEITHRYLHLVHPHPTKWDYIITYMSKILKVPVVPFSEWFGMLEGAATKGGLQEAERNPAIKLLDFFGRGNKALEENMKQGKYKPKEAMGMPDLQTGNAVTVSETLRGLKVLGEEDVQLWLGYWEQHGMFA
ncbi:acetyl-CoA synthetase-like protein [Calocera cornea HHB12733]|uniref:Acetyl-CoA synthetase-like protein n=1 Tax=Calocera cornea HHB12733 TaxID=1353952 RepID=A0A165J0M3_9BASI|nr:acetyl-CoA synthetase-like protein [Calocera cornea HHB12733]